MTEKYLLVDSCGYLWRPNAAGYTSNLVEAGLYSQESAESTEMSTGGDHRAVSLQDYIKERRINTEMVQALFSLVSTHD